MTKGDQVIAFIECLKVPEGALVGQHIKLEPFQKRFIKDIYNNPHGTNTAILSIARKNGKTALIAGLLLAHLVGPVATQNSQIISGAMSRDQAALVFKLAHKMVMQNEQLSKIVRVIPSAKQLIGLPMNVEFKAIAADGSTAQGLSPVLAIMDEVGQVKGSQNDFYDAILTAQGAHEMPLMINISTQAPKDDDLLSILIDDAKTGKDKHTVCHVYAADEDCDLMDKKAWKAANPALGSFRSLADMKKLAEKAKRMPSFENTFRNLNLNQRVNPIAPFISVGEWKKCANKDKDARDEAFLYGEVYAGLDLSSRNDLTAFVMVARGSDGVWHEKSEYWTPSSTLSDRAKRDRAPYELWVRDGHLTALSGSTIDYEDVAERIVDLCSENNVKAIAYDRWRIDVFKKALNGIELPLVEWGQGFKDATVGIEALEESILNGNFRHSNNPVLNMCSHNARVLADGANNRKFEKAKSTGRIDGLVALAMAFGVASREVQKPKPTYQIHLI